MRLCAESAAIYKGNFRLRFLGFGNKKNDYLNNKIFLTLPGKKKSVFSKRKPFRSFNLDRDA